MLNFVWPAMYESEIFYKPISNYNYEDEERFFQKINETSQTEHSVLQ